MLSIRKGAPFEVGDYVWLSLEAQKVYGSNKGKHNAIEERPFKVVHHENFDKYQVLLGQGVCATLAALDLVPCIQPP